MTKVINNDSNQLPNNEEPSTKKFRLEADSNYKPDAKSESSAVDIPQEFNQPNTIEEQKQQDQQDNHQQSEQNPLSKKQQKKLLKLAQWEIKKKEKRLKEREKYKQKRQEAIARGEPTRIGPSRKELKRNRMDNSANPFTVAIDLDFDDLMMYKDICKCAKQLLWVYTINRKSSLPLHLHYTGLRDGSRLQQALDRNDGYQNWDVKIHKEFYLDIFPREKIVYLTSDSDEILTELDKDCVYIIGGLVDHNHHKGLTLGRAEEKGIRTARLPLSENISIKTRTVLTIVHVFDILLRVSQGQNWKDALLGVLPMRKGAKAYSDSSETENDHETKKHESII